MVLPIVTGWMIMYPRGYYNVIESITYSKCSPREDCIPSISCMTPIGFFPVGSVGTSGTGQQFPNYVDLLPIRPVAKYRIAPLIDLSLRYNCVLLKAIKVQYAISI